MRICIISNYKKNGYGESTRPYYLSIYLKKLGHEIIHLCQHSGTEDGIRYIKLDTAKWEPSLFKRMNNFLSLYTKLKNFNPDVIYVHQMNSVRWALSTRVLPQGTFVMDAHTSTYFEHKSFGRDTQETLDSLRRIEVEVYKKPDYIICASEETHEFLIEEFKLDPAKLFAVGNATNMDPVTEAEKNVYQKSPSQEFTCLATLPQDGFIGNDMAIKYLLQIAEIVYRKSPTIKFVVVGGGEKPAATAPNIFYAGYVPDLRKEILSASICLMPFPAQAVCGGARNKLCDYVALGKLVVTSTEGLRGIKILENKKNCIVADDKERFADAIINLSQNAGLVKSLEDEAFKSRAYFNWEDKAKQVSAIFETVVKK
ncbi:MAG: hypothetical protein JWO06_1083 [Bacteroidota bacterium]|nr:hypothetical protein [Bacteroidota bacterium]